MLVRPLIGACNVAVTFWKETTLVNANTLILLAGACFVLNGCHSDNMQAQTKDRNSFSLNGVVYNVPASGLYMVNGYDYTAKDKHDTKRGGLNLRDCGGHLYFHGWQYGNVHDRQYVRVTETGHLSVDGVERIPK